MDPVKLGGLFILYLLVAGMGKELLDTPDVMDMYHTASHILGFDLAEVSFNGPDKLLAKTQVQQPAIFVASLAAVQRHGNTFC